MPFDNVMIAVLKVKPNRGRPRIPELRSGPQRNRTEEISIRAPRCVLRGPLQLFGRHTVLSLLHSITVDINGDLGWRPEIKRRPVRRIPQERYSCLSVGDPFLGMRPTR
jgi:hypothetical protein